MAQSLRQSELFAGQDWQVLYRAFTSINFNASDPPSINRALREYIQNVYPEDFNDWIESSEFIAIIDLLSWLAGTLAFKTDINARENFLETAESRESILRLARFLSYNPRRNQPARGVLKLQALETDDAVYDAFGNNLQNRTITWNNPDDADWFERMVLILNAAFVSTNPFGVPIKAGTLAGVKTQLYRLNARFGDQTLAFRTTIGGVNMPFNVINTDFDETLGFTERAPNMDSAMHLLYRSDGNGNASPKTGFFIGFKQGDLQNKVFNVASPIENLLLDIDVEGINQSDVWVQSVNDAGEVMLDWEKVPAIISDNITFNDISITTRNIFSVVTRDNDQVSVRFSDGRFGTAPYGNLRVWYRTSNGLQYQIRPTEMGRITMELPYINRNGVRRNLTMTFSLEEAVSNSAPRETEEQIRRRAPQVYGTQNRMVSGEDYNAFPLQSNLATKLKAITRVYSGHSRFLDLNDPTGNYQDTNVFSDDGIFYKEYVSSYAEVPLSENRTPEEIIMLFIQPVMQSAAVTDYVNDFFVAQMRANRIAFSTNLFWNKVTSNQFSSTGWFSEGSGYFTAGANLLFALPTDTLKWVSIADVAGSATAIPTNGLPGPVTLAEPVATGSRVAAIVPAYASTINGTVATQIQARINNTLSFAIWYDYAAADGVSHWSIANPTGSDPVMTETSGSGIRLMTVEYLSGNIWRFTAPGLRYVFESLKNVQFYFDGQRAVDLNTRQVQQDLVRVLKINEDYNGGVFERGLSLMRDYDLTIDHMIRYVDGYADPTRVVVRFRDKDIDGYADDPDTFFRIVAPNPPDRTLFWKRRSDGTFVPFYAMNVYEREADRIGDLTGPLDSVAFQINGAAPDSFWVMTPTGWTRDFGNYRFGIGRGPNVATRWVAAGGALRPIHGEAIKFQYKHFAPSDRRIDPAITNVIDMFVLTSEYDYLTRQWIANGAKASEMPAAPTELELRTSFGEFENFKMFSDDLVWRPVRYKCLFGTGADEALKATFKVVKLASTSMSDGEIKSRVVRAIGEYFSADYWDFGETFYFTELAAYVHQQLASVVASFVIVPQSATGVFGNGFEVKCRPDELFISTATVSDVTIISSNTPTNLRMN